MVDPIPASPPRENVNARNLRAAAALAWIRSLLAPARWLVFAALVVAATTAPAWAQVTFTKSFTDDPVMPGGTVTLEYTITNGGALPTAALTFTDDYDAALSGLTTSGGFNITLCAGVSLTLGTSTLTYVGVALAGGASCTFSVTLNVPSGAAPGTYPSTTSDLTTLTLVTVAGPATDNLVVIAPPVPTFTKAFSPSTISVGGTSTLTFTIDNTGSTVGATSLDFSDTLPAGVEVAATPSASTTCTGGTLTAAAATTTISYSGGSVGASSSCTVQVDVTATSAGTFNNTSGALTSSFGNSGTASATLNATVAAVPPVFTKAFSPSSVAIGGTSTLTFTIANGANPRPISISPTTFPPDCKSRRRRARPPPAPAAR